MREPLPQPLMIDGAQTFVRNASLLLNALGFRGLIVNDALEMEIRLLLGSSG